jgi:hypothetical protein
MSKSVNVHPKRITFNLSQQEYDHIVGSCAKTACRSLSEYCRTFLSGKPITVYYRDQAYDEFIETAIQLRKGLDAVFLHDGIPEIEKEAISNEIQTIKEMLSKIYDHVSQTKIRRKYSKNHTV